MITDQKTTSITRFPSFGDRKWIPQRADRTFEECGRLKEAKKVRIIVIDDEALIADTVAEILNSEGFDATPVSNGLSAIALAKTMHPDIVLSDVIMPGMNGLETGIRIRELLPNCNLILFSGQAATVDLLAKARQQGHRFEILAKPIKPEQLISVIRKVAGSLQ